MLVCKDCGKETNICYSAMEGGNWVTICPECHDKRKAKQIASALETVKHPSDFRTWEMNDMSEAFWTHLGRYKKKPNRKSLEVIHMAFGWACHADHGLSNSFSHAMKWCGIDLITELRRKDIPETDEED